MPNSDKCLVSAHLISEDIVFLFEVGKQTDPQNGTAEEIRCVFDDIC